MQKLLGNRIAEYRNKRGMTQQQLADALHIGRTGLSCIENGKWYPSAKLMKEISDVLQIPLGDIFFNPDVQSHRTDGEVEDIEGRRARVGT